MFLQDRVRDGAFIGRVTVPATGRLHCGEAGSRVPMPEPIRIAADVVVEREVAETAGAATVVSAGAVAIERHAARDR